jgi:hypothetical protein
VAGDTIEAVARLGTIFVIALAACGNESGTFLSITSPMPLSHVELFIGDEVVDDPGSCSGGSGCSIGPPTRNATTNPYGVRYRGDGYTSRAKLASYVDVSGTHLVYRVQPETSKDDIPALMIVGYGDQGQPAAAYVLHDLHITGSSEQIDVTLDPVLPIDAPSGERLQIWRRPGDTNQQSACALLVYGDQRESVWFVPEDDTDCDGAAPMDTAAPECKQRDAPWNWCGVYPPGITEADTIAVAPSNACRLQGPQCADRGPMCPSQATEAFTQPIGCIQQELCHQTINNLGCNTLDSACAGMALGTGQVPHITCFGFTPAPCTTAMDLASAPIVAGRNVTSVDLLSFAAPGQFGPSITINAATYTVMPGPQADSYLLQITGAPTDGPGALIMDFVTDPQPTQHRFIELDIETTTTPCSSTPQPCIISTSPFICP